MIVKVATGYSFKGAWQYFLHDKDTLESSERVAWTHTENSLFDEPWPAVRGMIDTAERNERAEKTTVTLMLAWSPEENPDKDHMIEAGRDLLKAQGLEEHEALFICHNDEPQPHLHIIANRVHPETLISHDLPFYKLTAQKWALAYEQEHGLHCEQRVENFKRRDQGAYVKYQDNTLAEAWTQTDNGQAFKAMLEDRGWQLAMNRRVTKGDRKKETLMAVTPSGRAVAILRELNNGRDPAERLRKKEFMARFADLDLNRLPTSGEADKGMKAKYHKARQEEKVKEIRAAEEKQRQQKKHARPKQEPAAKQDFTKTAKPKVAAKKQDNQKPADIWDREAYARAQDEALIDAAIEADEKKRQQEAEDRQRGRVEAWGNRQLARQQDRHLAERADLGKQLFEKRQQQTEAISNRYRFPKIQLQQQIEELEARLDKGGLFYTRKARREDQRQLAGLKDALARQTQHETTELNALNQAEARQRQALADRQAEEIKALKAQIAVAMTQREIPKAAKPERQRSSTRSPASEAAPDQHQNKGFKLER